MENQKFSRKKTLIHQVTSSFYLVVLILVAINYVLFSLTNGLDPNIIGVLLIVITFLFFYWIYKSISQKEILLRSLFYPNLFGLSFGLYIILLIIIRNFFNLDFKITYNIVSYFIIDILIVIIMSISYEIIRYVVSVKNNRLNKL